MKGKYERMLKSKPVNSLIYIFIYSICLFLFTACGTNEETEHFSEQGESSMTQDLIIANTEIPKKQSRLMQIRPQSLLSHLLILREKRL